MAFLIFPVFKAHCKPYYISLLIYQVMGRCSPDAIGSGNLAFGIHQYRKGDTRFLGIFFNRLFVFFYINGKNRKVFVLKFMIKLDQGRHLLPAPVSPGRPEKNQNNFSSEICQRNWPAFKIFQGEIWGGSFVFYRDEACIKEWVSLCL